jgi:hypothetical protein
LRTCGGGRAMAAPAWRVSPPLSLNSKAIERQINRGAAFLERLAFITG